MAKNYIDNVKFTEEVSKYTEGIREAKINGKELPRMSEYIGTCVWEIANRLAFKPNFINYTYRDEMVGDGIENCLKYIHNFDGEKSQNAFAYVTQIIFYAFLRRIKREKKQDYIKYKLFEREGIHNLQGDAYAKNAEMMEKYNSNEEYLKGELHLSDKDIESYEKQIKSIKKYTAKGLECFFDTTSDEGDEDDSTI